MFEDRYRNDETGRKAIDPKVLLKIVLFGYSRGLISSRPLERACLENITFMALSCGQKPDYSTIAAFVSSIDEEIEELFTKGRQYPQILFERYADDGICHCRSKAEEEGLRVAIERRFAECGLELNLQKTKIVYCKDSNRRGEYPEQKFDFLGFTFRPRRAKSRQGRFFVSFIPAISNKAAKSIRDTMRQWQIHRRTDTSLGDLAKMSNPVLRGWINYYGSFNKSALYRVLQHMNNILVRWATRKYKRLRGHHHPAWHWLQSIMARQPSLFAHWRPSQVKAGQ